MISHTLVNGLENTEVTGLNGVELRQVQVDHVLVLEWKI